MYIQDNYFETFLYFLEKSGGQIEKIESPHQPDYKGNWRGDPIWSFRKGGGYEFHGSCIKELHKLWSQTLQEITDEVLKNLEGHVSMETKKD